MKFPDLISWLLRLSETTSFKQEMEDYFKYHDRLDQGRKNYTTGELIMLEHVQDSPKLSEVKYSFDENIYYTSFNSNSKIATNVLKPLIDTKSEAKLFKWEKDIELALRLANSNSFYLSFPNYLKSLQLTQVNIKKLIIRSELQENDKRGNPNWKGLNQTEKATIITKAQELLSRNPDEYSPKKGSFVSERLKIQVTDDLKDEIESISRHKVARVLLKHYAKTS